MNKETDTNLFFFFFGRFSFRTEVSRNVFRTALQYVGDIMGAYCSHMEEKTSIIVIVVKCMVTSASFDLPYLVKYNFLLSKYVNSS